METIQTERLVLRTLCNDDFNDFYEYAKSTNVCSELSGWTHHVSSEQNARNFLASYVQSNDVWAIVLKENGRVIGHIKIYPDTNRGRFSEQNSAKLITYALSERYWGHGYMTEAVTRAVKYAFDVLGVEMLTAIHYPHNTRSKRVIEKCGFEYEGIIKNGAKFHDGRVFDCVCYSKVKQSYPE
jgi:RimJ/RimL family protein N-acetyltransferase